MVLFPPAKINLGLNVLFKQEDGYHAIDTCMVPIPIVDVLEMLKAEQFSFYQSGLEIPGTNEDNLCVKAYRLMVENYYITPVYIHLRKEIPMGAGLGGGSSDAAYVLKGINDLFTLNLSLEKLEELAAQLGSDCSFFIKNEIQIGQGRGEILSACNLSLKGYFIKLVNPGIHIGTQESYSEIKIGKNLKSVRQIVEGPIENWKAELKNDFEKNAFISYSVLAEIKEKLYADGAVYAAMSGSGSTMFGIYKDEPMKSFVEDSIYYEEIREL